MYTNPTFEKFSPKATRTSVSCGCKAEWYIPENVEACYVAAYDTPEPTEYQKMWCKAWFAEIGWYDKYADYMSNSWVSQLVSGPYATEEEALAAAKELCEKKNKEMGVE